MKPTASPPPSPPPPPPPPTPTNILHLPTPPVVSKARLVLPPIHHPGTKCCWGGWTWVIHPVI